MRSRAFQATFALFAFTIALFVLAVTAPARATQPGVNGKIAFCFDTTGQLYTINPDGTGLFHLTNVHGAAYSPDWSPDAHRIAFSFDDDTHGVTGIINAEGTDLHAL